MSDEGGAMIEEDDDLALFLDEEDDDWESDELFSGEPPPRRWPPPPAEEVIAEMVEIIVKHFDPLAIILFGSRARGDNRPLSDVDLLVVFPEVSDKRETSVAVATKLGHMPLAKDIIATTYEEMAAERDEVGSLFGPALRDGKVLYDRRSSGTQDPRPVALRLGRFETGQPAATARERR